MIATIFGIWLTLLALSGAALAWINMGREWRIGSLVILAWVVGMALQSMGALS